MRPSLRPRSTSPVGRSGRSGASAMAWNEPKSSPAQNARPSPDSTTARTDGSALTASPASISASNMAGSRAFIFSGRLRRTSATPPSTVTDTRSDMGPSLPCMPDSPAMNLNLSADEVLSTTRAVRKRLDLDRPVEREVLLECLELALQAPTGSNSQGWQWMFVTDPAKKKVIADYYGSNFDKYIGTDPVTYADDDPRAAQRPRVTESATYLREHFHEVPVLLIPL